jgi:hypothetical protein
MRNKIIIILIILILLLAIIGYWTYRDNTYSKEVLRVEIFGPEKAVVGEEIEYSVRIKNNGDIRLEDPQLIFEYPGSAVPSQGNLSRVAKGIDDFDGAIQPGQEKTFQFKGKMFGQEGEIQEAKAIVSYRPKNLQAGYVSKTSHIVTIGEVPLTFEFDLPSGAGSGQELNFSLNYFSSINHPLSDLEIRMTYPATFVLKETVPRGVSDSEWRIPLLNKTDGGRINFKGALTGEKGETKIFSAEIGIWKGGEFVPIKEAVKQVNIIEPSLYVTQNINSSRDYIAKPGDLLRYEIIFRNVGDKSLQKMFLVTKLYSPLFDFQSIRVPEGRTQEGDNSILWDWQDVSTLQFLEPGEEGSVEFWIQLKDKMEGISKPRLENEVILGQARMRFVAKVHAQTELSQMAYIDDEVFGSQGNLPLKPEEEGTFTIIWRVKNYFNSLQDVKVRGTLPTQVNLTGGALPEALSFDSGTGEVVWTIGELQANQGVKKPFQMAFQVKLRPSADQIGDFAELVGALTLAGKDEWTTENLTATTTPITTEIFGEEGRVR